MRSLAAAAADAFDRRLSRTSTRPLAVALSGGGDSLAATLLADAWAREVGRELIVLTVDHGLQAQSGEWTDACRATAERLGRSFQALRWEGEKPASGLPAAARSARHRLLAEAARIGGASVVMMGHTADDAMEAAAMRLAGGTTPSPREWSPSPVWPEGRGIFLLRPLISVRRADLRDWLAARGERWIDDPANEDPRYARSRARAAGLVDACAAPPDPPPLRLAQLAKDESSGLSLPRDAIRAAPGPDVVRFLGLASVCAGGGTRRAAASRLVRLAAALQGPGPVTATLAGARIEADEGFVRIGREAGEVGRGGLRPSPLTVGAPIVWDGRFEITATPLGLRVERLAGRQRQLSATAQRRLAGLPAAVRGGLPAVLDGETVACPVLEDIPGVSVRSLVGERLAAASGLVGREGA